MVRFIHLHPLATHSSASTRIIEKFEHEFMAGGTHMSISLH